MNVTRGSSAVAAGLAPLLTASRAEGFRSVSRLADELESGYFDGPGAVLFGAYDDDIGLVGVVGLTRDPYVAEPYGKEVGRVRHLYVLPAHRSAGVGRALIAAATEAARRYYRVLRLRTDTPAAAAFYHALGFSECLEPNATHALPL